MPMDPQLAAIYGTNADEGDVEKLAAAELAEKLAEGEEFDPEALTPEQAEELAQQILAAGDESEEEVAEEPTEEEAAVEEPAEKTSAAEGSTDDEEAKEKLAEADYLGRVMAHAYVNELKKISSAQEEEGVEKTAISKTLKAKAFAEKGSRAVKAGAGKVGKFLAKGKQQAGVHYRAAKFQAQSHPGKAGLAAGIAGGGALGVGAGRLSKKEKKSAAEPQTEEQMSALDTLALQRAEEILAAAQEQEKTSASEQEMQKLQAAVDARAMEMLTEAGYQFEEPKAEETQEEAVEEKE